MATKSRFLQQISPEILCGVTVSRWLEILKQNSFSVDIPYWPKAAVTTLFSIRNSAFKLIEDRRYALQIEQTKVESPVFVVGVFRSGTTYLHHMLSQDSRFAFPNLYEVIFPHTFLTLEKFDTRLISPFLEKNRPQDNVLGGLEQPNEDEIALCNLNGGTFLFDLMFNRNAEYYRRYYTLQTLSDQELAKWKKALQYFLKKLTFKYHKTLLLKSPAHMCRVKLLLETYPDAKFIHIHRNPFDVFTSWCHSIKQLAPRMAFQRPNFDTLEDDVIACYLKMGDTWLDEKSLIAPDRIIELSYQSLKERPLEAIEQIYRKLSLPDFEDFRPFLKNYLASQSTYKTNEYPPIKASMQKRLLCQWNRFFEEWGYEEYCPI